MVAAVAIDYAGPAWLTRERLRGLQRVAVAHFAERYGLFVIICLGESIVAIGLAANGREVTAELVAAVGFGLVATIGLWRTYFGELAVDAERSLHREDAGEPLTAAARLTLCGGVALYLLGHAAFRRRMVRRVNAFELVAVAALVPVFVVCAAAAAWLTVAIVAAVLAVLCFAEASTGSGPRESPSEAG